MQESNPAHPYICYNLILPITAELNWKPKRKEGRQERLKAWYPSQGHSLWNTPFSQTDKVVGGTD